MSGKFDGASGETAAAMARPPSVHAAVPCSVGPSTADTNWGSLILRLVRRLVEALDLGVCAQLGHEIDLRLAHRELLDLVAHGVECRRLALALVLDLEHVPAELRLDGVGDLALVEPEGHLGEFRHHLLFGEI